MKKKQSEFDDNEERSERRRKRPCLNQDPRRNIWSRLAVLCAHQHAMLLAELSRKTMKMDLLDLPLHHHRLLCLRVLLVALLVDV
jgi:hypothetical protein